MLLDFQNGYHLAYTSQRMWGGIWLTPFPKRLPTIALMETEPLARF